MNVNINQIIESHVDTKNRCQKTKEDCIGYLGEMLLLSKPNNYMRKVDEVFIEVLSYFYQKNPDMELGLILTSGGFYKKIKEKMPEIQEELYDSQVKLYLCLLLHYFGV